MKSVSWRVTTWPFHTTRYGAKQGARKGTRLDIEGVSLTPTYFKSRIHLSVLCVRPHGATSWVDPRPARGPEGAVKLHVPPFRFRYERVARKAWKRIPPCRVRDPKFSSGKLGVLTDSGRPAAKTACEDLALCPLPSTPFACLCHVPLDTKYRAQLPRYTPDLRTIAKRKALFPVHRFARIPQPTHSNRRNPIETL